MVGEPKPEHPLPPRRPPLSRRQLLMQVVVAGIILASGIGIGTGGTILALKNRLVTRVRLLPPGPPGPEPNSVVERWRGQYALTDKQAQQARETLVKQFTVTRALREKFMEAEKAEQEKFAAAMKKIFNPEQYGKWEEDLRKRFEHFRGMRPPDGRGGGRGGPPRGERGSGRSMDPDSRRGGWSRDRSGDPNGPPPEGPPRPPKEFESRRGDRPPRGLRDADAPVKGDQLPSEPADVSSRPEDGNTPR